MEINDQEYLKLFEQIKKENQSMIETKNYYYEELRNSGQMLKETPNYSNYNNFKNQNINEIRKQNYSQDYNLNEFNIETRIDGQNINEVRRQEKENRLNEVMQKMRDERLNEVKQAQERQLLNEVVNFKDVNVVTLDMFEKARYNSMMQVANQILPK